MSIFHINRGLHLVSWLYSSLWCVYFIVFHLFMIPCSLQSLTLPHSDALDLWSWLMPSAVRRTQGYIFPTFWHSATLTSAAIISKKGTVPRALILCFWWLPIWFSPCSVSYICTLYTLYLYGVPHVCSQYHSDPKTAWTLTISIPPA